MDGDDDDAPGGPASVPCAVCGRAVQVAARGTRGTPGLGAGHLVDNRALCKSCESGRYRSGAARRRR